MNPFLHRSCALFRRGIASLLIIATSGLVAFASPPKLSLKGEAAGDTGTYILAEGMRTLAIVHVSCGSAAALLDYWDIESGLPEGSSAIRQSANSFPIHHSLYFARDFCLGDEALSPENIGAKKLFSKLRQHYYPKASPFDPF